MAPSALKAAAMALAAAGALVGADDLLLVQRSVESAGHEFSEEGQALGVSVASLLHFHQLESGLRRERGEGLGGPSGKAPEQKQQCSQRDFGAIDKRLALIHSNASAVPLSAECEKATPSAGRAMFPALQNCVADLLDVRHECAACASQYLKDAMALVGGCVGACLPQTFDCKEGQEPSEKCVRDERKCMACNRRHWVRYIQCLAGGPKDDVLKALEDVSANFSTGRMEEREARMVITNAFNKRVQGLELHSKP